MYPFLSQLELGHNKHKKHKNIFCAPCAFCGYSFYLKNQLFDLEFDCAKVNQQSISVLGGTQIAQRSRCARPFS
jgi:hypothetical protein